MGASTVKFRSPHYERGEKGSKRMDEKIGFVVVEKFSELT
jgi:hypothetical protein